LRVRTEDDDRLDDFWIDLWNTIEGGTIPLHLAVQLTSAHLAKMWSGWMASLTDRESIDNPAYLLMVAGLGRELVARMVEMLPAIYPDTPWLAESAEAVAQEARSPGSNPLLRDRLRATVARGPANVWLTLRRGLESLTAWTDATRRGSRSHNQRHIDCLTSWHALREFIVLARNAPHPPGQEPWIDEIIAALGPPTLEQIVAAAEVWRRG